MNKIYEIELNTIDNQIIKFSEFEGKTLLIVNVASKCGFTSQYKDLQSLYNKYKEKGFYVLGFPCNQFGAQEPGSEEDIKNFCQTNYDITFPMFAKIDVNGENAHPLYKLIKPLAPGVMGTEAIKWNFTKFLINKNGEVLERFAPKTSPKSLESKIEEALI